MKIIDKFIKSKLKNDDEWIKINRYYSIFNVWLYMKQRNMSLVDFFEKNNYKTIAIYGMKELGERLYDEIRESKIKIACVIDNNNVLGDIFHVSPEEVIPDVDVIVVTADYYYAQIKKELEKKVKCPIVSISEVIANVLQISF